MRFAAQCSRRKRWHPPAYTGALIARRRDRADHAQSLGQPVGQARFELVKLPNRVLVSGSRRTANPLAIALQIAVVKPLNREIV